MGLVPGTRCNQPWSYLHLTGSSILRQLSGDATMLSGLAAPDFSLACHNMQADYK